MSSLTQEGRPIAVETPLGKDVLLLTGFSGQEEMSRLFAFQLDLVSTASSISPGDIVGKRIGIRIRLPDDTDRYWNGFVSRFSYCGSDDRLSMYRAEMVPWLWFLTQTADCRIFQQKTVPQIVEQVFKDLGFGDYEIGGIRGGHPAWDYCVQYRETDFQFVSRLLEQEGIFYFFKHEASVHTLVLADEKSAYLDAAEKEVRFASSLSAPDSTDLITGWEHQYRFLPGKWAHTDFNFEMPSTSLLVKTNSIVQLPDIEKYEVYDYPGEYETKGDGEPEVKIRMEAEEVAHETVLGSGRCRSFDPGYRFTLAAHHNQAEQKKSYVLTSVQHAAVLGGSFVAGAGAEALDYRNSFSCIPDALNFRPARITPRPVVHGAQTAIVVGPKGEEIYTDRHGRVKVQFHWDREGKRDENSSCWIRVSHPWAGKGWGAVSIPRIGQEVIVEFLEGDPDRPIITGRVYNAEAMPPYDLPGDGMVSGIKSESTPGGGGYNEISMNDTKGEEGVTIHGQYDMSTTVEHDQTLTVHNNRTTTVDVDDTESVGSNQKITVGANQEIEVKADQKLRVGAKQTIDIGSDQTTVVGANQVLEVGADRKVQVSGSQELQVSGDRTAGIKGSCKEDVTGDKVIKVGGGTTIVCTGEVKITGSGNVLIEGPQITLKGGSQVTLKVGGNSVMVSSGGVEITATSIKSTASASHEIKGAMVKHNC